MKIAYFTNMYPRATDTFIRREVFGLRERGIDILTYSVRKIGENHDVDERVLAEKKNTQYLLPASVLSVLKNMMSSLFKHPRLFLRTLVLAAKTSKPGLKGAILQVAYFLEAIQLSRLMTNDGIDHIHNHFGDSSGTVTMLTSTLTKIPYSISIHGPHIFFDELNWALEEKTRNAKFVTCIGSYCRSKMMLNTKPDIWDKLHIVRCGIDLQTFQYQKPSEKIKRLIFLGRLSPEKGITILLDSIILLRDSGYSVELVVLGDGEDRENLQRYVYDKNLDGQVKFVGFVDQEAIIQQLKQGDILVLPSFAEGIPVVLMEAMAMGVPVIATYIGGVAELVVPNVTGQLVFPSDIEGLAQAISHYIDHPEIVESVSIKGREMVEREFNTIDQVERLEALFLEGQK